MIVNIKIYCSSEHPDYDKTYDTIKDVLEENRITNYEIERINKIEILYSCRIFYQPHIVVNNEVVYTRSCPSKADFNFILRRKKIIK